jgi:Tfp pilus assembly protein PilF
LPAVVCKNSIRVRKAGTQLRITAQLISVRDGFHLWSHTFKRELPDIFAVQEEIARSVRGALAPHFGGAAAPPARHYEPNPVAHDLYLKGRYAQARLIGGSVEQAIGFFDQAIAADPNYAGAYAGLADAWYLLAFYSVIQPHEALPKAKAAAQHALAINDALPEARASLGVIQCAYDWNWDPGRRNIERALELDPDSPVINQTYANLVLGTQARLEEAIALLRKITLMDPFLPQPQASLTFLLGVAGRVGEAEKQHHITPATNPNYFFSHRMMGLVYETNGMFPQAIAEITKAVEGSHGLMAAVAAAGRSTPRPGKSIARKGSCGSCWRCANSATFPQPISRQSIPRCAIANPRWSGWGTRSKSTPCTCSSFGWIHDGAGCTAMRGFRRWPNAWGCRSRRDRPNTVPVDLTLPFPNASRLPGRNPTGALPRHGELYILVNVAHSLGSRDS